MLQQLEKALAYSFHDRGLLEQALVHSSYYNEHRKELKGSNERLEYLGDAVLELSSSRFLYDNFPLEPEGALSKRRASIVCEVSLAACARKLKLGKYIRLGHGELQSGGADRDSLLSDSLEAIIGAMYLDGGFEIARLFVYRNIMQEMADRPAYDDAKSQLQEYYQARKEGPLHYELRSDNGPQHDKLFEMDVYLGQTKLATGYGHTKKAAEQDAAAKVLSGLNG